MTKVYNLTKNASYAFRSTNKVKHSTHACDPRMLELLTGGLQKAGTDGLQNKIKIRVLFSLQNGGIKQYLAKNMGYDSQQRVEATPPIYANNICYPPEHDNKTLLLKTPDTYVKEHGKIWLIFKQAGILML